MRIEQYHAGVPCWVDLMTSDQDAAIAFYGELFGWEAEKAAADMGNYAMCYKDGQAVAGIGTIPPGAQYPPSWTTYFKTDDVAATAERITAAGGQLVSEVMDVSGSDGNPGKMVIFADPTGAVAGAWQPIEHKGSGLANEPGSFTWNELLSTDPTSSREFLSAVFDYTWEPMAGREAMDYQIGKIGDAVVCGVMTIPPNMPTGMPSNWMTYFAVADADDAVVTVSTHHGRIMAAPSDTPYGRMSPVADPQGAPFVVMALADPPA